MNKPKCKICHPDNAMTKKEALGECERYKVHSTVPGQLKACKDSLNKLHTHITALHEENGELKDTGNKKGTIISKQIKTIDGLRMLRDNLKSKYGKEFKQFRSKLARLQCSHDTILGHSHDLQAEIDRLKGELPDEAIVTPFITYGQGQDITEVRISDLKGNELLRYTKQINGDKWLLKRGEEDE